jgi:dihydrofolate synthase/folylpolyglutamate synthase
MRFSSLSQWLTWQEQLHFRDIDPGLERVGAVWQRMGGTNQLPFKLVTVAGTNGKGSSVAISAAILQAAGYKTATYTSPHLLRYNERICIDDQPANDDTICEAFQRIDDARGDISLTYFEFATLAAVDIFCRAGVDVAILEVGMGGRLDAVNLFDTDVALITPIGLDHMAWLGDNREQIGYEKAGIIRSGKPLVCSETQPPETVLSHARQTGTPVYCQGDAFSYQSQSDQWCWQGTDAAFEHLPLPVLAGSYQLQNSAAVIEVCQLLNQQGLKISEQAIRQGLTQIRLYGRFQHIPGPVTRILDVTHNQQGADNLSALLKESRTTGKTYAVLAMLRDKDCQSVATTLNAEIDFWFLAGLDGNRGMSGEMLAENLAPVVGEDKVSSYDQVEDAYHAAMTTASAGDRILIFGSFHTIEAAMRLMPESQQAPVSQAS